MSNSKRPSNPNAARLPHSQRGSQLVGVLVGLAIVAAAVVWIVLNGGGGTTGAADAANDSTAPGQVTCTGAPSPSGSPESYPSAPEAATALQSVWEAHLETNCGDITLELYGDKAPQTVASFNFLAEKGFWENSPCHRLTTEGIYVLQCGDPTGTGSGGPGYGYGIENAPTDGSYPRGTLAMARAQDPNSNGSQFFIVYEDSSLPVEGGGYSIFGKVTGGLDILDYIAKQGVEGSGQDGAPVQAISIEKVTVTKAQA